MKDKYGITLFSKERFNLVKDFNTAVKTHNGLERKNFKVLKHIEDYDERQEGIHAVRS
jgi:hypothetical protein